MNNQFSSHIFWDTDPSTIDLDKNKAFVIKRVLEFGKLSDWILLRNLYSIKEIAEEARSFKTLDKKALSFIAMIAKIPKESFKCYKPTRYQQALWNS